MSNIVVGYDGSDCGRAALEAAVSLAKELGDQVVIVYGYAPGGYGGGEVPTHREAVEELGEKVTAEAERRAGELGIPSEVKLVPLKPDHALVQVSEERATRMIVVGTHSDPPLRGAILGSTPHKLLHESEVPVLVVPSAAAGHAS
jgi:nucleotide-binding universal stress UspA family protein